jgi:hypothetical protein
MLTNWTYEELGVPTFTIELWNPFQEAGIDDVPPYNIDVSLPDATMARVLQWAEQYLPDAFLAWRPYEHPQLGPVELGGWNRLYVFRNPPGALVEPLAQANARFIIRHAGALPRVEIEEVKVARQDGEVYSVQATVGNAGYQATYLSQMALDNGAAQPVMAEIAGEDLRILDGASQREVGHLSGRSDRRAPYAFWGDPWGTPRRKVSWLVQGQVGTALSICAGCPRAGYDARQVVLE